MIPELQFALTEEYKKDLPDPNIYQISEEDMYLYVPVFNRKNNNKISMEYLQIRADTLIAEGKNLRENGISLANFSSIDKTVNAAERQTAIDIISQELETDKNNMKVSEQESDKKDEDEDIPL